MLIITLIDTNWNSGVAGWGCSRTDVHCPVICAITCPSQCRQNKKRSKWNGALHVCLAQVRASKLRIVTHLSVSVSVSVPSQGQHRPPALSHGMAGPSRRSASAGNCHSSSTTLAQALQTWEGEPTPWVTQESLTFQSREEFGNSYYLLSNY